MWQEFQKDFYNQNFFNFFSIFVLFSLWQIIYASSSKKSIPTKMIRLVIKTIVFHKKNQILKLLKLKFKS